MQEVIVEAPAGSVVFTHCGILHAGSINRLPTTRFFISCYINRVGLPVRDIQQGSVRRPSFTYWIRCIDMYILTGGAFKAFTVLSIV